MSGNRIRVWVMVGFKCAEQFPALHIPELYGLSIPVTTIFWMLGKSSPSGIYLSPIRLSPKLYLGTLFCDMLMGVIPIFPTELFFAWVKIEDSYW
jgi:hypothetical protein